MSEIVFNSKLKQNIEDFLKHKHELGNPYKNGAYYLADFDRYCLKIFPDCDKLQKSVCLSWAVKRSSENASGFLSRVTPLRQLGKYLVSLGYDAYVLPDRFGSHVSRPTPYIFSTDDLRHFFDATDNMERYYQSVVRHYVAPVMFRYLYCCGLRPQEARNIYIQDVNLETGKVFIRESKGNRERIVMLTEDMINLTTKYLSNLTGVYENSEILFPDRYGMKMSYDTQNYLFGVCLTKSGISTDTATKPNLYSFRHSYATHRLYMWMKDGHDISAKLPYLSAFMGHTDFSSSAYYIHLVPGLFQEMSGMDLSKFESLIPEVDLK